MALTKKCPNCNTIQCSCAMMSSNCINVTGNGSAEAPFVPVPIISPEQENILTCTEDGLLVNPCEAYSKFPAGVPACGDKMLVQAIDGQCKTVPAPQLCQELYLMAIIGGI